jgi:hypothetical protein
MVTHVFSIYMHRYLSFLQYLKDVNQFMGKNLLIIVIGCVLGLVFSNPSSHKPQKQSSGITSQIVL